MWPWEAGWWWLAARLAHSTRGSNGLTNPINEQQKAVFVSRWFVSGQFAVPVARSVYLSVITFINTDGQKRYWLVLVG